MITRAGWRLGKVMSGTVKKWVQYDVLRALTERPKQRQLALRLIHEWGGEMVATLGLDLRVRGTPPADGTLWIGNHRSYVDIAVLAAVKPCLFLAKSEIANWPIFGSAARAGGMVFVKRDDPASRKVAVAAMSEMLAEGVPLVVFPEGTTSKGALPRKFKLGAFAMSKELDVTISPFALNYDDPHMAWIGEDTFVGHFLRTQGRRGGSAEVSFADPVSAKEFNDGASLCKAVHGQVGHMMQASYHV